MSHIHASTSTLSHPVSAPAGLSTLMTEAVALIGALFNPGPLVKDVEDMGRLLQRARRLEATDPVRAAELLRTATRMVR